MRQLDEIQDAFSVIERTGHDAVTSSPLFDICSELINIINDGETMDTDDSTIARTWYEAIKSLNPG